MKTDSLLNGVTNSQLDGNPLWAERLEDAYDDIALNRGICRIGTTCDDEQCHDYDENDRFEENENNFDY